MRIVENQCWYKKNMVQAEWILLLMPVLYSFGYIYRVSFSFGLVISFVAALLYLIYLFEFTNNSTIRSSVRTAIYIIVIYSTFSLFFTLTHDYNGIRSILLNPALYLPYISILLAAKRYDYRILHIILIASTLSALLFILFSFLNFTNFLILNGREFMGYLSENSISFDDVSKNFAACLGLILILSPCLHRNYRYIIIAAFIINISIAVFLGRRNIIFTNCLFLIFSIYSWVKFKNISKFLKFFLYSALAIAITYVLINGYAIIQNSDSEFLKVLSNRIDTDSRGMVIEAYYKDMNSNVFNWIFGKGIESTYYCPGVEETPFRHTIEAGWQHIIMKLGFIGLFCYLFVQLKAMTTKRTNILLFACTSYILISIIELYPAGVPAFHLRYVLIWICAAICFDSKFSRLNQKAIEKLLNTTALSFKKYIIA